MIAGYLVFGLSAVLMFQIAGVDPHADTRLGFKVFSVAYGVVFALGAGWLAARLAPGRPLFHAAIVSAIIAVAATGSLVGASGAKWSQLAALLLMTPAACSAAASLRGSRLLDPVAPGALERPSPAPSSPRSGERSWRLASPTRLSPG